jgi:protein-S-isoprenylcysteine O-methyltransferase Ste14
LDGLTGRVVRTAVFAALLPASIVIFIPRWVLAWSGGPGESPWQPVGLAPIAVGAAFLLWCWAGFVTEGRGTPAPYDPPRRLVSGALYAWVRNPMYVAITVILVGEAMFFWSAALLLLALATSLVFHLFVVLYEEPGLRTRFGAPYEEYTRRVRRWIPRPPRRAP